MISQNLNLSLISKSRLYKHRIKEYIVIAWNDISSCSIYISFMI